MRNIKTYTVISAISITILGGEAKGETASDIGTLPSQKIPASVESGDRNPFATKISVREDDGLGAFDGDTEESKIRQIFAGLEVSGRVPASEGSPRVLVGDLILKEGEEIPQVIENQTDVLKVTRISETEVEITWIDEVVADAPRKLVIPIKLEPVVSFILPGRGAKSSGQFVTMAKPEYQGEGGADRNQVAGPSEGYIDELAEKEDPAETATGEEEATEERKRVSPFGLFRR